jgi:hypothetical protein
MQPSIAGRHTLRRGWVTWLNEGKGHAEIVDAVGVVRYQS